MTTLPYRTLFALIPPNEPFTLYSHKTDRIVGFGGSFGQISKYGNFYPTDFYGRIFNDSVSILVSR